MADEKEEESKGLPPPPISPTAATLRSMPSTRSLTPVPQSSDGIPLREWSHTRVSEWVASFDDDLNLSRYSSLFESARVSGEQLARYTKADFSSLGIDDESDCRELFVRVRRLRVALNRKKEQKQGRGLGLHHQWPDPLLDRSSGTPTARGSKPRLSKQSQSESPPPRVSHSVVSSLPAPSRLSGTSARLSTASSSSGLKSTGSSRRSGGGAVISSAMSLQPHPGTKSHHHRRAEEPSSSSMIIPRSASALILTGTAHSRGFSDSSDDDDDSYEDDGAAGRLQSSALGVRKKPDLAVTAETTRSLSSVDDSMIALPSQLAKKRKPFALRKHTEGDVVGPSGLHRVVSSPLAKKSMFKGHKSKSKSQSGMKFPSLFGGTKKKKKKRHKTDAKVFYPAAQEHYQVTSEGWLKKRGPKASDAMHDRYCQLYSNGHFFYFPAKPNDSRVEPKGYIDVKTVSKLEFVEGLRFQIIAADTRVWYFECLSQMDMVRWMTNLKSFLAEDSRISVSTSVMAAAMHDLTH